MCIFIYQDTEFEKKTPKSVGKKVFLNYDAQLIFVPNYDDKPNFVPNYDGCCFCPELQRQLFYVPNYDGKPNVVPNFDGSAISCPQ